MNGPLVPNEILTPEIGLVFALVAGLLFGFFLERAGFGSARKLTAMFYFRDFALLRVMFTAVVVGAVGLLLLGAAGRIDLSMLAIPGTYLWPQALGGLLIGLGFVVGGYCPGTAAVGAASGGFSIDPPSPPHARNGARVMGEATAAAWARAEGMEGVWAEDAPGAAVWVMKLCRDYLDYLRG